MGKLKNIVRDRFSVIPNEVFLDRRLDYRSKGLLCLICSLPDGWNFSVKGLIELVTLRDANGVKIENQRGEGDSAIRASIKHLEQLGYLKRIPTKDEFGHFAGYDYEISIPATPID